MADCAPSGALPQADGCQRRFDDLIARARAAVTVKEEAESIMHAVHAMVPETKTDDYRHHLMNTARLVWADFLPRPVLLGVVSALAKGLWTVSDEDGDAHARYMATGPDGSFANREYSEADGSSPALALLIAILEASK